MYVHRYFLQYVFIYKYNENKLTVDNTILCNDENKLTVDDTVLCILYMCICTVIVLLNSESPNFPSHCHFELKNYI